MIAARTGDAVKAVETVDEEEITVTESSGNVFEDLGFRAPAEALLKADLARQIGARIRDRGLTQAAAAEILGVDQPKVSALVRGRLSGFTIDRLVRYAAALGQEVDVVVRPRGSGRLEQTAELTGAVALPRALLGRLEDAARDEGVELGVYVAMLLGQRDVQSRMERKIDALKAQMESLQQRLKYDAAGIPTALKRHPEAAGGQVKRPRAKAAGAKGGPVARTRRTRAAEAE